MKLIFKLFIFCFHFFGFTIGKGLVMCSVES